MRPLLSWRNWMDVAGATIAVDNETDGLGGNNLLTPQIAGEVWRATYAGATRNIRIDLGQLREIGVIGLALPRDGVQPQQSDGVRIRLGSTAVDGADVLDTSRMSFDTFPYSIWCYPLAGGVRPNLIYNPSMRDSTAQWNFGGAPAPLQSGRTGVSNIGLADVGGGYAARAGSTLTAGQYLQIYSDMIAATADSTVEFQALMASTAVACYPVLAFYNGATPLSQFNGASIPGRNGQYKSKLSEWSPAKVSGLAPAGTTQFSVSAVGAAISTVADAYVSLARAAAYVADPAGATPIFSDHYVGLAGNVASLEATAFARYVTISITSAQAYLDIGRLWIGPAFVGAIGPSNEGREIGDAGDNVRASLTGLRFPARGQPIRSMSLQWPLLTEAEARRLNIAAEEAGRTGQVLAVRDVLRAREGTIIGSMTQPPAPTRGYPLYWKADLAVQEDL